MYPTYENSKLCRKACVLVINGIPAGLILPNWIRSWRLEIDSDPAWLESFRNKSRTSLGEREAKHHVWKVIEKKI